MADVFSQLYIQTVFSVKNRKALIHPSWEEELYQYTTGIIQERGHKMLAIGGMPDHIHILNQKEHHKTKTFEEEFLKMLADFEVEIGRKTMFDFFELDS